MSKLAPAAREIIAGRHADPFSYLGQLDGVQIGPARVSP